MDRNEIHRRRDVVEIGIFWPIREQHRPSKARQRDEQQDDHATDGEAVAAEKPPRRLERTESDGRRRVDWDRSAEDRVTHSSPSGRARRAQRRSRYWRG